MELNERLADLSLSVKETNLISLHYDEEDRKVLNGYTFLDTIGRGSYSKVKLSVKEGKYFAVKVINKYLLKKKRKGYGKNEEGYMTIISMLPDALNEIQVLKFIHEKGGHKNIIKLIEIINDEEKEKIYLILEFCSKGAIINFKEREQKFYLSEGKPYTEDQIKYFIRDLAQGLKFLHDLDIVHRDIKTDNILIDEEGHCKLSDFNVASIIKGEDRFASTEGNFFFYPPEFCGDGPKDFSAKPADIWAIGVSIYTCCFQRLPFVPVPSSNMIELFKLIKSAVIVYPSKTHYSSEFLNFLSQILEKDPMKRLTANQILSHPYLTNNI